ncbi:MAG: DUF3969 family protein [Erysipelotrichaceae bacterium]|nr:DUF3969 family protein [Erysipelotrichaceae bacterium]
MYNNTEVNKMIIPKEFEGLQDLEAMLLTSMLGTFEALKEDLISIQQAESYWLSDFTAELFEEMKLSREIVALIQEGVQLKELQQFTSLYYEKLDSLISSSKQLIARYYTEYDDVDRNEIEIKSALN